MFLFNEIELAKKYGAYAELPSYISDSLNPNFKLREYQKDAFCNFITYFENNKLRKDPTQVLFHMATGSGKTLIMAGLIVYLYKKGYRNFVFFVNSSNIIRKTKDNFLNSSSMKYLFADEININGEIVRIKEVTNFQGIDSESINICFTTIQGLHSDLWNVKENSLTFDDFTDKRIVLISDEAHHINVDTKKRKLSEEEKDIEASWEYSVNRVFRANKYNIMLEFTATCDLENKDILSKYLDKIIFDYPLKKFREDGFSKEVETIQADIPLMQRAIQATLLNQYRLKVFEEHGLSIKPVILFKAATINDSKEFMKKYIQEIKDLTNEKIVDIARNATHPTIKRMFDYFAEKAISFEHLALELREEFNESRCISVNDDKEAELRQIIVNTLEDSNNPYRAIFEVKKLDEGWDVLNLFDIVRLYETRDGKNGKPGKNTILEAQLIGRGARYCPFKISRLDDKYRRKYDEDLDNPLRVCEELYYHCQYDSRYIAELKVALKETGIMASNTVERQYKLKEEFKREKFYKEGLVFFNEPRVKSRTHVVAIPKSVKDRPYKFNYYTGKTQTDIVLKDDQKAVQTEIKTYTKSYTVSQIAEVNYSIVHKAIRKYEIFKFGTLKDYFPNLNSIREFILSDAYLGGIKIEITCASQVVTPEIFFLACCEMLGEVSENISKMEEAKEGDKNFFSKRFHEIFKDKRINIYDPHDEGHGVSQNAETISNSLRLDLSKEDWYVFNDNYGTTLEKAFVKYFSKYVDVLKAKYSAVYLVRNERQLPIYSLIDGDRFEPDFLLFLQKSNEDGLNQLQIFIEPKGGHLIERDIWKEEMLLSLEKEVKAIPLHTDDNQYYIWGFPFYNEELRMVQFDEVMERIK